ncbi:MAG: hypothetical protein PQJ58_17580 [Spirochaetales bacterium]|nr:hypothetical protein [Spirochaetales bacterium]
MKKIKHLYIHIGKPKTGTTTLQNTLFNNRDYFISNDIYYPGDLPVNHGHSFSPVFMDDPTKFIIFKRKGLSDFEINELCDKYKDAWIKEFEICTCNNFIICGENLFNAEKKSIEKMKNFLDEYFDRITIVLYVREFASFLTSFIQQLIKAGVFSVPIEEKALSLIDNHTSVLYYKYGIENWSSVFSDSEMIIKPFIREKLIKENIVDDFLNIISSGIDLGCLTTTNKNESLGFTSLKILEQYNIHYPLFDGKVLNPERGINRFETSFFSNLNDTKFSLSIRLAEKQKEIIINEIKYVNSKLCSEYKFKEEINFIMDDREGLLDSVSMDYCVGLLNNFSKKLVTINLLSKNNKERLNKIKKQNRKIKKLEIEKGKYANTILKSYKKKCRADIKSNLFYYITTFYKPHKLFNKSIYRKNFNKKSFSFLLPYAHFIFWGCYHNLSPNGIFDIYKYVLKNPNIINTNKNILEYYTVKTS